MNPITIHVTDECLATLRDIADQRGTTVPDLLDSAKESDMLRLLRQLGRHNWVYLGSDRGGQTMAVLRSLVASCELVQVDPFAWFRDVLSRIPTQSIRQLDSLLPHAWAAARA